MNAKNLGIKGVNVGAMALANPNRRTGIRDLDAKLAGGFPTGSSVVVLSEPCNAPYLFCEQFAAAGAEAGERVYYYSLERPRREVEGRLAGLLSGPGALDQIEFYDFYSVKMHDLSEEEMAKLGISNHVPDVTRSIGPFLLKQRPDRPYRVVFESLTEAIRSYGFKQVSQMFNLLTGILQGSGGLALLTLDRGLFQQSMEAELRHLADGVIELGEERNGADLHQFLAVTKMRGVPDSHHLYWYKESARGIMFESVNRVN